MSFDNRFNGNNILDESGGQQAEWLVRPFSLVRLWDILMPVFPKAFFQLLYVSGVGAGRASAQEGFLVALRTVAGVSGKAQIDAALKADELTDEEVRVALDLLTQTVEWCGEFGLPATAAKMEDLVALMSRPPVSAGAMQGLMADFAGRMIAELKAFKFVYVTREKGKYHGQPNLFGEKVTDNFTEASFDIEEAGNCLALERNTATVMHLMRVIEVALHAVGTSLGIWANIKTAQPNWGDVLTAINNEIQARNRVKPPDPAWLPQRAFFEDVYADLRAVKTAWRNPSMHVDKKYDAERAQDIFNAVNGWVRHLAEHLDESGTFTA